MRGNEADIIPQASAHRRDAGPGLRGTGTPSHCDMNSVRRRGYGDSPARRRNGSSVCSRGGILWRHEARSPPSHCLALEAAMRSESQRSAAPSLPRLPLKAHRNQSPRGARTAHAAPRPRARAVRRRLRAEPDDLIPDFVPCSAISTISCLSLWAWPWSCASLRLPFWTRPAAGGKGHEPVRQRRGRRRHRSDLGAGPLRVRDLDRPRDAHGMPWTIHEAKSCLLGGGRARRLIDPTQRPNA
jgi:hypothetical protein